MMKMNTKRRKSDSIAKKMNALLIVIITIFTIFAFKNILFLPSLANSDGMISRTFSLIHFLELDYEPSNRNVAWKDELPNFIKEDIQYAEKNNIHNIQYECYHSNIIELSNFENQWELSINDEEFDSLKDFSIYKTKDQTIVVYGYSYGTFIRKEITLDNKIEEKTMSFYPDLPLDLEYSLFSSDINNNVGGYSLLYESNNFTFYKNGKEISSFHFDNKKDSYIKSFTPLSTGAFTTSNNELFWIMIDMVNNKPHIQFQKIDDSVDELLDSETLYWGNFHLPILKKSGRYYTLIPNDWELFKSSCIHSEKFVPREMNNLNISLGALEDCFSNATFTYSDVHWNVWICEICFNLNGKTFFYEYQFNGYDNSIHLPDEIAEKYAITVNTPDDVWNNIEQIRSEYGQFYDQQNNF